MGSALVKPALVADRLWLVRWSDFERLASRHPGAEQEQNRHQMVTDRHDWVARFALRLATLDGSQHHLEQLIALGEELWSRFSGVEPEVVAEAEFRAGSRM